MVFRFFSSDGYKKEDFLRFIQLVIRRGKVSRWAVPLWRVIVTLAGVFLLVTGFLMIGSYDTLAGSAPFLLMGVLAILLGAFRNRLNASRSRRMMLKKIHRIEFVLSDDGIREETDCAKAEYTYQPDYSLAYYKEAYFLFVDKRHAFLLPVRNMTEGTPEELEKFWEEKMGKPVEKYK